MTVSLPPVLQLAVDAIKAEDTEALVTAVASDGLINDWSRILKGRNGVGSWAHSDASGASAKMTVLESKTTGELTHIVFNLQSRVFNGSQAYVIIADHLIAEFPHPRQLTGA